MGSLPASGTGVCVCAFGYVWRERDCVYEISLCICTSLQQCMCCTKVCVCVRVSAWHCSEPWCPLGSARHTVAVVAEKGNSWHYWERDRVWTERACACVRERGDGVYVLYIEANRNFAKSELVAI